MNRLETDMTLINRTPTQRTPIPKNKSYQHAHDSKTYYLPLPIIRHYQAGKTS